MRARYALVSLVVIIVGMGLTAVVALAGWKSSGEGGCDTFAAGLSAAQAGDVLTPMRSGVGTNGAILSKSLLIQGGWAPDTGSCASNVTSSYASRAAMLAGGFSYDPSQRSTLFGDGLNSALRLSLANGQTAVLQNLDISVVNVNQNGNAISGTLDHGARLRLENLYFVSNQSGVNAIGGSIYLELRGGSQLVIANSTFINNNAISGGAVEVHLFGGSSLLVEGSTFTNNNALNTNGGALRVVVENGTVTLRNNTFTGNQATNGSGGAFAIERASGATGAAWYQSVGNTFSGNTAAASGTEDVFASVGQPTARAYLPLVGQPASGSFGVTVKAATLVDSQYRATFSVAGYTPVLPGRHVHFFFNTVPPSQAGMPGSGPWKIYGSSAPFTGYGIADRPAGATQLCALVANADHSVIQGTGNCVDLP